MAGVFSKLRFIEGHLKYFWWLLHLSLPFAQHRHTTLYFLVDFYMNTKLVTGYSYKLHTNEDGVSLDANEKKTVALEFSNHFSSSDTFDISLTLKDSQGIMDAWENAVRFTNPKGDDRKYKIRLLPNHLEVS